MIKQLHILILVFLFINTSAVIADEIWPWSIKFMVSKGEEIVENEASLWIGNSDEPVRGIILTSMVRNEIEFNYDEQIRAAAKEAGLAMLFLYGERSGDFYTGGAMSVFNAQLGHDTVLFNILNEFATLTGKPEIAHAPWLTFGHSTAGIFARNIAWWKPERMFGVIFYKTGGYNPPEWLEEPDTTHFLNVPWLSVAARNDKYGPGETGWKTMRKEMMPWRQRGSLMSEIVEPTMEEGHSEWRPFNAPYFAMWIKKAAKSKIPPDTIASEEAITLLHIDTSTGVLSDTLLEFLMDSARIKEDLLRFQYDVDPEERGTRFWHFDDEMAIAWVNYHHKAHGAYVPERDSVIIGTIKYWFRKVPLPFDPSAPEKYDSTIIIGMNRHHRFDSSCMVLPDTTGEFDVIGYNRKIIMHRDVPGSIRNPELNKSMLDKINGMDAFLLEEIINEKDDYFIPSVFQVWAADVSMDGVIDQNDLAQVTDRALLRLPEFKQDWNYRGQNEPVLNIPSLDWVFIDSTKTRLNLPTRISKTYPGDDGTGYSRHRVPPISDTVIVSYKPGNPYPQFQKGIFYGTMLGDIDGSFAYSENDVIDSKIILDIAAKEVLDEDAVRIPLKVESSYSVFAADLEIQVDAGNASVSRFEAATDANVLSNTIGDKSYMISWTASEIQTGETFAWLVLEGDELYQEDIVTAIGYLNGKKCVFEVNEATSSRYEQAVLHPEIEIYPVPANEAIHIRWPDKIVGNIELKVYDTEGRMVLFKKHFMNSAQTVSIELTSIPAGNYIVEMKHGHAVGNKSFSKY